MDKVLADVNVTDPTAEIDNDENMADAAPRAVQRQDKQKKDKKKREKKRRIQNNELEDSHRERKKRKHIDE